MVLTRDADVVVILLSNFHYIKAVNPASIRNLDIVQSGQDDQNDLPEHSPQTLEEQSVKQWPSSMHSLDQTARLPESSRASDTAVS